MRNRTIPDAFPSFTLFFAIWRAFKTRPVLGGYCSVYRIASPGSQNLFCHGFAALYDFTAILESEVRPILTQTHCWSVICCFHHCFHSLHGNYTNLVGRNARFDSKNLGVLKTMPESCLICLNVLERESNRTGWRNLPTKWDGDFQQVNLFVKIWFLVYGILRSIHLGPEFVWLHCSSCQV